MVKLMQGKVHALPTWLLPPRKPQPLAPYGSKVKPVCRNIKGATSL